VRLDVARAEVGAMDRGDGAAHVEPDDRRFACAERPLTLEEILERVPRTAPSKTHPSLDLIGPIDGDHVGAARARAAALP